MPTFMGVHERLPRGATAEEVAEAHRGCPERRTTHGVRFLRYWIDDEGGKVFCLAEGPTAEAAAAAHREARGIPLDRIYRVREGESPESTEYPSTIHTKEAPMSEPFIFIGTHNLKEGKLEEYGQFFRKFCESVVEANEPRVIAFNGYANKEGTETSVVQVHPDSDSMLFHMKLVSQHISEAYEDYLGGTTSIQIYGSPSEATLELMRQISPPGVPLIVKPFGLGGFTRSSARL